MVMKHLNNPDKPNLSADSGRKGKVHSPLMSKYPPALQDVLILCRMSSMYMLFSTWMLSFVQCFVSGKHLLCLPSTAVIIAL